PGREPRGRVHPDPATRGAVGLRVRRRPLDGDGPRPPGPRENRGGPLPPAPAGHGVGRGLPVPAVSRRGAWRPVALVAAVVLAGGAGTLAVGALLGMDRSELVHLGALLVPAALATVVATAVAGPLLARTTIRARFLAVAVIAAVASLVNLFVLSALMIVSSKDAALIGTLLLYSMGAGVGAAWALGRSSADAVD